LIFVFVHSNLPADKFRVHLRVRNTAEAIQRTGLHQARLLDLDLFMENTAEAVSICQEADVIVIHRYLYGMVLEKVQYWKAREKKIIVDFDQPLDLLTPDMPEYEFWMQANGLPEPAAAGVYAEVNLPPTPADQFRWGLRLVDAACVPSARLADDWSENIRTYRIPDYINTDQYLVIPHQESQTVNVGVDCSGLSADMMDDIGIVNALAEVCKVYDNLHIYFMNGTPDIGAQITLRVEQYTLCEDLPVEEWPSFLSKMDIGLMPVVGGYALRSSWLRALEFMALKIPWLASDLPPYREVGRFGLLVPHGERYWKTATFEVLSKLDHYRKEAAGEPFLFALSQDIQENVGKILSVYMDV
jgi:hypothetical protein